MHNGHVGTMWASTQTYRELLLLLRAPAYVCRTVTLALCGPACKHIVLLLLLLRAAAYVCRTVTQAMTGIAAGTRRCVDCSGCVARLSCPGQLTLHGRSVSTLCVTQFDSRRRHTPHFKKPHGCGCCCLLRRHVCVGCRLLLLPLLSAAAANCCCLLRRHVRVACRLLLLLPTAAVCCAGTSVSDADCCCGPLLLLTAAVCCAGKSV
jgi:hypothetical protein